MNKKQAGEMRALIFEVVAAFHELKAVGNEIYGDLELNASMRGLLLNIQSNGPATVPKMARQRPVSRQHIQIVVNRLLELGYIQLADNPEHKRSKLVELTPQGRRIIERINRREAEFMRSLPLKASAADIGAAAATLAEIRKQMAGARAQGLFNDRK